MVITWMSKTCGRHNLQPAFSSKALVHLGPGINHDEYLRVTSDEDLVPNAWACVLVLVRLLIHLLHFEFCKDVVPAKTIRPSKECNAFKVEIQEVLLL